MPLTLYFLFIILYHLTSKVVTFNSPSPKVYGPTPSTRKRRLFAGPKDLGFIIIPVVLSCSHRVGWLSPYLGGLNKLLTILLELPSALT